ncbi:hypothetical protein [Actinoplanes sp. NPDC051494]|uniref:hypothetical protein n=1 Tax=Actinoplanes sp. NPDC051494 TaxID=3363907 RepID=UPI0037B27D44
MAGIAEAGCSDVLSTAALPTDEVVAPDRAGSDGTAGVTVGVDSPVAADLSGSPAPFDSAGSPVVESAGGVVSPEADGLLTVRDPVVAASSAGLR